MEDVELCRKKEVLHKTLNLPCVLILHISILLGFLFISSVHGWDRLQYCKLNLLAERGSNPYDFNQVTAATGYGFFLTYPPLILEFFARACNTVPALWYIGDALAYIGIVLMTLRRTSTILSHILFVMNFGGLFFGFGAGNIQLYESVAFTAALVALASRRYSIAGLLLGGAIFLKLQSLLLFPLILLSVIKDRRALTLLCIATIVSFTSLHLLSAGFNSVLEVAYWEMLRDHVWFKKSDIIIGPREPTLRNLCIFFAPEASYMPAIISSVFYTVAVYFAWRSRNGSRYLYLALLFGFVCYPRLASYSFSIMLLPTIRILEGLPRSAQLLVAACSSVSMAITAIFVTETPLVIVSYLTALAVILCSLRTSSVLRLR